MGMGRPMQRLATKELRIELPDAERGLSASQVVLFDKLKRRLLRSDLKPAQREAIRTQIYALETGPREVRVRGETDAAIAETIDLAEARGEEVTRNKTAIRVTTHDGLHSLYVLRKLSQEQYDEGLLFRRAWGRRSADLTPPPPGEGAHSSHLHEAFIAARTLRAFDLQRLGKLTVHVALKGTPNALAMLQRIAGDGIALSAYGKGRAFDRNLADLRRALDLCSEIPAGREQRA
jgi:hypothetical protein